MEVVSGDVEELFSEALVGINQNSVGVVVELGGDILDQELDLVDETSSFTGGGSLEGGGLLGLLVVGLGPFLNVCGLDLGYVELGSEGVSSRKFLIRINVVEEILEGGDWESSVLLVDL